MPLTVIAKVVAKLKKTRKGTYIVYRWTSLRQIAILWISNIMARVTIKS